MDIFKMCVRPHLEYFVQVWCPYLAKDINPNSVQCLAFIDCTLCMMHVSWKKASQYAPVIIIMWHYKRIVT